MDKDIRKTSRRCYFKQLRKKQKNRWREKKKSEQQRKVDEELSKRRNINKQDGNPQSDANGHRENSIQIEITNPTDTRKEMKIEDPKYLHEGGIKELNTKGITDENKIVGSGTFGQCHMAHYRNILVVVKTFKQPDCKKKDVLHEASVIASLGDHQGLPLIFGVCTTSLPYKLVLQFHGEEESLTIHKAAIWKSLSNKQWKKVIHGVKNALGHIHERGFLHNDIKGNNIVLETSKSSGIYNPVIIDFGKSCTISNAKLKRKKNLSKEEQLKYSKNYPHIAPEIVNGCGTQSIASDIFSFAKLIQFLTFKTDIVIKGYIRTEFLALALKKDPKMRPMLNEIILEGP